MHFFIIIILFLIFSDGLVSKAYSSSLFTKDCSKEKKYHLIKTICDGDTVSLGECTGKQKDLRIRFLGIDSFETKQNNFGKDGKRFLTELLLNKEICIESDVQEKDKYGRTLGYVFINKPMKSESWDPGFMDARDQIFVNEELLKKGYAILYNSSTNKKYIDRLKKAQIFARQNMLGIWKEKDYIIETPAQWRQKHKNNYPPSVK